MGTFSFGPQTIQLIFPAVAVRSEPAYALQKIANDKAQIATNHVRRVVFDEFSRSRHDKSRARYLRGDVRDNRLFSF